MNTDTAPIQDRSLAFSFGYQSLAFSFHLHLYHLCTARALHNNLLCARDEDKITFSPLAPVAHVAEIQIFFCLSPVGLRVYGGAAAS
jgi:hypothetical protein